MRRIRKQTYRASRTAFTLVEMLAVTIIIALLASLITMTVFKALDRAKEVRMYSEVDRIAAVMEKYRVRFNEYPPSDLRNPDVATSEVYQFFARHFPRYNIANLEADLEDLGGADEGRIRNYDKTVYQPAKALHLWLEGLSPDMQNPLVGGGVKDAFEFDEERVFDDMYFIEGKRLFTDDNEDGVFDSADDKYDLNKVYVYCHYNSKDLPFTYDGSSTFLGYEGVKENAYQVIACGLDGKLGKGNITFPGTTFQPDEEADRDNITNFAEGKTLADWGEE